MQVKHVSTIEQLASLREQWRLLDSGVPFRGWEWLGPCWRHLGGALGGDLYTLACFDGDALVAIAPWYRQRTPLGRVVRALGDGAICSDYLGVPCAAGRAPEVAEALARYLTAARRPAGWDLLRLEGQDPADPVLTALCTLLRAREHAVTEQPGPRCWRITLPCPTGPAGVAGAQDVQRRWDQYLGTLSRSHRSQTRRIERRCQALSATLHVVRTASELGPAFDLLVSLHQRRRNQLGDRGLFASPQVRQFHREAAELLLRAGRLWLAWLEVAGQPVAAQYGALAGQTLYVYQSGLEPAALEVEPGRMMLVASLRHALTQNLQGFDLLRGDEPYKSHFRAVPQPSRELLIAHRHLGGRLGYHALTGGRRLRTWARGLRGFLQERLRPGAE